MSKSKFFLLLAISLLLFSLSGCGVIGDYSLSISIEPFKEIHDLGYVNVNVEGKSGLYSFHNDGDIARLNADVLFPVGIKFIGWGGRDGHLVNEYTGELLMNKSMQITAKFELDKGVAIYDTQNEEWFDQMENSISSAIGSNRTLWVFPGTYTENDIPITHPFLSIYSLLGPQKTKIIGNMEVKTRGLLELKGFTFDPGENNTAITFLDPTEEELELKLNIFKTGNGIVFENDILLPLLIENNSFQGEEAIKFQGDIDGLISINQNLFAGATGPLFQKDIYGSISIKNNTFEVWGEGLLFQGILQEKIYIENNTFEEVAAGINFTSDANYSSDIFIKKNTFRDSLTGIYLSKYQDYTQPSLIIEENNFHNNSEIGIYFEDLTEIISDNSNPYIRKNNFSGNKIALGAGEIDWESLDYNITIDARGNWWGSKDGPSPAQGGDPVVGPIEVYPWSESKN